MAFGDPLASLMVDYFCGEAINQLRQLAATHRKYLYSPYAHAHMAQTALAVSAGERYLKDEVIKPIPKTLLKRRLPGFDFCGSKY